eukprot:GHVQ01022075.1.p1 GENE.GHVQ01022075.1~~GHVQ01022075.1.p1  ORF type:complete len:637 (+),score=86.62 GHVQ01022075.1:241-2151(+)
MTGPNTVDHLQDEDVRLLSVAHRSPSRWSAFQWELQNFSYFLCSFDLNHRDWRQVFAESYYPRHISPIGLLVFRGFLLLISIVFVAADIYEYINLWTPEYGHSYFAELTNWTFWMSFTSVIFIFVLSVWSCVSWRGGHDYVANKPVVADTHASSGSTLGTSKSCASLCTSDTSSVTLAIPPSSFSSFPGPFGQFFSHCVKGYWADKCTSEEVYVYLHPSSTLMTEPRSWADRFPRLCSNRTSRVQAFCRACNNQATLSPPILSPPVVQQQKQTLSDSCSSVSCFKRRALLAYYTRESVSIARRAKATEFTAQVEVKAMLDSPHQPSCVEERERQGERSGLADPCTAEELHKVAVSWPRQNSPSLSENNIPTDDDRDKMTESQTLDGDAECKNMSTDEQKIIPSIVTTHIDKRHQPTTTTPTSTEIVQHTTNSMSLSKGLTSDDEPCKADCKDGVDTISQPESCASLPFFVGLTWKLHNASIVLGVIVCVLYWTLINPFWGGRALRQTFTCYVKHGGIALLLFANAVLSRLPWPVAHIWYSFIVGILYSLLSVLYFVFNVPHTPKLTGAVYSVFNFNTKPVQASFILISVLLVFVPVAHMLPWCLFRNKLDYVAPPPHVCCCMPHSNTTQRQGRHRC